MQIRAFRTTDTESVVALWEACGLTRPWNDPRKDIARKLLVQPELFVVGVEGRPGGDDAILATAMAGYDGHRGWVYYVAVDPELQGGGHGARIMREVERLLVAMGCPKITVQIREGNDRVIGFYEHLGFAPDGARSLGKRLVAD